MPAVLSCPQCNLPLPLDAPHGLCPACLVRAGLGGDPGLTGDPDPDPGRSLPAGGSVLQALGAEPVEVWAGPYLVAVMSDEATVRALKPDLVTLEQVSRAETLGRGNVGVAALAEPGRGYDVVDRFFAPGSGIPEDPTTGSLHCILAPLFADKLGRARLAFHQAYPGRGGDLVCEARGPRVSLAGQAVTVVESRLRLTR